MRKNAATVLISINIILALFLIPSAEGVNLGKIGRASVEHGLNQGSVYSVLEDDRGFIWVASGSGINIYDGYSFKNLPGEEGTLAQHEVYHIRQDSNGIVWYATSGRGLYSYDHKDGTYKHILGPDPDGNNSSILMSLAGRKANVIWVITSKSVIQFNTETNSIERSTDLSKFLPSYNVIYTAIPLDKNLMIGTTKGSYIFEVEQNSVIRLPLFKGDFFKEKEANKHYKILAGSKEVYVGTNDGLFAVKRDSISKFIDGHSQGIEYDQLIPKVGVWDMVHGFDELLVSAEDGLYQLNPKTKAYKKVLELSTVYSDVGEDSILALTLSSTGLLWMGSKGSGIYYLDLKKEGFKNYQFEPGGGGLSNEMVRAISQDVGNEDEVWVGTANGLNLINLIDKKVTHYLVANKNYSSHTLSNIYEIRQYKDILILSTSDGIKFFNKKSKTLVDLKWLEDAANYLNPSEGAYTYLNGNSLWVISEKDVMVFDLESMDFKKSVAIENRIGSENIWNVFSHPNNGNEFLLSTNKHLWSYDKKLDRLSSYLSLDGIPNNEHAYVDSIAVDKHGVIWVAYTGVGIVGLDADTHSILYQFNNENSDINNHVYGVYLDESDNLWFSSNQGIFRLDRKREHVRRYRKSDGIPGEEYNGGAYSRLRSGEIIYGGMKGLTYFDPARLLEADKGIRYEIQVSDISVMSGSEIQVSNNSIVMSHDAVGIKIEFTTNKYFDQKKVKYTYKLVGPDELSISETAQNYISFPKLRSGEYILKAEAISPYTGERVSAHPLRISVSYAPWASPLAYVIYTVFLVLTISSLSYYRYMQRQKLMKAHSEVKSRENTLLLALEGSDSEVWDWVSGANCISEKRVVNDLGYTLLNECVELEQHISLIHVKEREQYREAWKYFLLSCEAKNSFNFSYRMKAQDGKWLWYRDLGKVVEFSQSGKPIRVTGTYTNITQSRMDEQKAETFGKAFMHSKDWVFIVDENFTSVLVNPSLRNCFGFDREEFEFYENMLGVSSERKEFYKRLLKTVRSRGYWSGEDVIVCPKGVRHQVLISISFSRTSSCDANYIVVMTDISQKKAAENELLLMANYDQLTGLPNRNLLLERVRHAIERANRAKQCIAMMFIDLDRFKNVNDSLGHHSGDLLLKEVSNRLASCLRQDDTVSRIGGDEFVVLLERFSSGDNLSLVADKILAAVGRPIKVGENVVSVGASIGISIYPDDSSDQTKLLRNADIAMYFAKQKGRNNYQFYTEKMNQDAKKRLGVEQSVKSAHLNREFFNYYQPIVDAHTGKAVAVELLLRWRVGKDFIPPSEFIPVAEDLGLIKSMTMCALESALKELKEWRGIRGDFGMSVNISSKHIVDDQLHSSISTLLDKHSIPASALKLEVTESSFIDDPKKAAAAMAKIHKLGCRIALDDFGTGFSSLSYIKNLPLDMIKIDKSFVNGIGLSIKDEAIIDSILTLSQSLGITCVAEGVETKQQVEYLVSRKCNYIQGFLYCRPIPPEEVTRRLIRNDEELSVRL